MFHKCIYISHENDKHKHHTNVNGKALFTRNVCVPVCVNVNVNFNVVLVVTQTHTHRIGLKPIPCVSH